MSLTALWLVLGAALLHAGWNLLAKRAAAPGVFLWMSLAIASVALSPAVVVAAARGEIPRTALPFVAATGLIHAVYFTALGRAYAAGDFSQVYPIARGLGIGLIPPAAWFLFDERLSALGVTGIVAVLAGVVGVGWPPSRRALAHGALGWAVVTGLCTTAYSLVDRAGIMHVAPLPYVSMLGLAASALLAPMMLRRRDAIALEWRAHRGPLLVAASLHLTAYLLVLLAFGMSKTGYVVAAREVSIVLSAIIGSLVLREVLGRARVIGALLIFAGVALIATSR